MPGDLDRILQLSDRWDFSIVTDGKSYLTRRLMVGELGALANVAALTRGDLNLLATELIVDGPDVTIWHDHKLALFFSGYLEFFKAKVHTRKKGRRDSDSKRESPGQSAQKLCAVVLKSGIARDWREAPTMPADWAINLLNQMNPSPEDRPRKDKIETMADGTRKMSFASIEGLAAAMKSANFSGVQIGR